jgi:hypothetical protein
MAKHVPSGRDARFYSFHHMLLLMGSMQGFCDDDLQLKIIINDLDTDHAKL